MVQLYVLALLLLAFTNNTYLSVNIAGVDASGKFTLVNNCAYTVWPGVFSGTGITPISTTGFVLPQGESNVIQAPSGWNGQFWARTHCSNNSTGKFTCLTGDCGSGKIECDGSTATLPVTLADFTVDAYGGIDFYDVSLNDGYNIPLLVVPQGGNNCSTIGCVMDLNTACPARLKVTAEGGEDIACTTPCAALNQDVYCCRGAYSSPDACVPNSYTKAFKSACPLAFSYIHDDVNSMFNCAGADYIITFCPTSQNQLLNGNNSNGNGNNFMPSSMNGTFIYHGETDFVNSRAVSLPSITTYMHVLRFAGTVAVAIAIMQLC